MQITNIISAESENCTGEQMYVRWKERRGEEKKKKRDGFPGLIFRQLRAKHLVIFKDNKHESEEKPVSCVSASR